MALAPVIEAPDAAMVLLVVFAVNDESGAARSNAVDFATEASLRQITRLLERKPDAGRAAADRQNIPCLLCHEMVGGMTAAFGNPPRCLNLRWM